MKARIGSHEIVIDQKRVRGGVEGHARRSGGRASRTHRYPTQALDGSRAIGGPARQSIGQSPEPLSSAAPSLSFVLSGQMQSGKNRVLITRTGHRYPPKRFAEWRDKMVNSLEYQIATGCGRKGVLFCTPVRVSLTVHYTPGDKIRRDVPGILDALCHVLERAGVVEDDAQIKEVVWKEMELDRARPRVELTLTTPPER